MKSLLIALAPTFAFLAACAATPEAMRCADDRDALGAAIASLPAPRFYESAPIAPELVRADLRAWLSGIDALHPAADLRIDREGLARTAPEVERGLVAPLDQRQAWLALARLNPFFQDGHTGVLFPQRVERAQAYLDAGGRLFPGDVAIVDGRIFSLSATGELSDEILSINGEAAADIASEMLAITEGDTPAFGEALASRRFVLLYWLMHGDTGDYVVETLGTHGCVELSVRDGATAIPVRALRDPPAASQFSYRILPGSIGYLRAASFDGNYADAFASLAREAFTAFEAENITALIVDIRDNGGGDDELWMQNIMEHITTRPYRHVSSYAIRVTAENADPGDVIGSVSRGVFQRERTPQETDAMRFDGPTYILVGRYTYSSAIVFAATVQDSGVALIAGEETGGFACQTGRITPIGMANTGLAGFAPALWLARPSGEAGCGRGVVPDVALANAEGESAIDELAEHIRRAQLGAQ